MRYPGIPLPEPTINNDLLTSIIVVLGVSMLVLLKQPRSLVLSSISGIISNDSFFAKNATIGDHIKHYILLVISLLGLSFYAVQLYQPFAYKWEQIGFTFLAFCSFFAIKLILMNIYFRALFGKKYRELIYQYISLIIIIGFGGLFGYILLQYAPLFPPIIVHACIAIICLCCALLEFYILIKDFFNRAFLIIHFILYLCTLEIMPLLIIAKSMMKG